MVINAVDGVAQAMGSWVLIARCLRPDLAEVGSRLRVTSVGLGNALTHGGACHAAANLGKVLLQCRKQKEDLLRSRLGWAWAIILVPEARCGSQKASGCAAQRMAVV
jgi:hypothetical protein